MKNLIHLTEERQSYEVQRPNDFIKCIISNPNSSPGEFDNSIPSHYTLSPSGEISAVSVLNRCIWTFNLSKITSSEKNEDDDDDDLSWFHLYYDENSDMLVALSHSGNIVSIDPFNNSNDCRGELIGNFDFGISCADWSADGELLALVTYSMVDKENADVEMKTDEETRVEQIKVPTLMTMNTQFEILAEVNLPPISIAEDEAMVDVCWNRKFDNALIAVSCHDIDDNMRKVRIFKGDTLELMSISRTEDGSGKLISNIIGSRNGCVMAWAGNNTSNLLACVQRKGKRGRHVVFLEPNGLQHGGFKLDQRQDCEEVVGLKWNAESDILVVRLVGTVKNFNNGDSCANYGKIQFYHRSNYHWYLKNEIRYEDGISVSTLEWDKVRAYELSVGLQSGDTSPINEWRRYTYVWDTSTTSPRNGAASIIDGCHLNISMFQRAIVPPPMYSSRLSFTSSLIAVAHSPIRHGIVDFVVHLSNGTLFFCGENPTKKQSVNVAYQCPEVLSHFDLTSAFSSTSWDACCLRQLLIVDVIDEGSNGIIISLVGALCPRALCGGSELVASFKVKISPNEGGFDPAEVTGLQTVQLDGTILRLVNWLNDSGDNLSCGPGALLEMTDGALFEVSMSDKLKIVPCQGVAMFLEPCPCIAGLKDVSEGQNIVIGLSSRYRLYCGERQLCDASSSFCLSPSTGFLSYVTLGSRSQLRFLPLDILANFDPLMGSDDNLEMLGEGYEPRNVERGSRLVSILPDKITAVLQLPRGNLEAVYPRALLLPRIMTLINGGEYHVALDLMRRQKVDMNLIVDMNPKKFLESEEGVEKLLSRVQKMDHLNLFIASLSNFDFTLHKYPIPKWICSSRRDRDINKDNFEPEDEFEQFDFSTKVNKVCEKMRTVMMKIESSDVSYEGKFLLPILSTFAKQEPPKLEAALSLIKENAINTSASVVVKNVLLSDKAQSSIQYLAFLADYKLLFDTALGMYDFDLAKAVARNSQMDPKVYLPMLKRLISLPEFDAKHEVDVRLKRYESALRHLYKANIKVSTTNHDATMGDDEFSKCMSFIENHNLHKVGLTLFINHTQRHGKILVSLGENLLKEQRSDLALAVFLAAKPKYYDGAKKAARDCGDWKTFFTCMVNDPDTSSETIRNVASSIAEDVASGRGGLYGRRERKDVAARILLDYCNDVTSAIDMLISVELWFEARRIALLYNESAYTIEGIIDSATVYSQSCLSDFEERADKFADANSRYREVVFIRRQAQRDGETGLVEEDNIETGSLFSMASNTSNTSVRSNMSTSSIGSVSSLSSVISAGGTSTFSVINDHTTRHKSKFNTIGKKKKKKKTRRERMSLKPGSEEELQNLISRLQENIIDDEYIETIVETIKFLSQVDKVASAKVLFDAYNHLKSKISQNQVLRMKETKQKSAEMQREARRDGQGYEEVILDCEESVDKLCCKDLPPTLQDLFLLQIE